MTRSIERGTHDLRGSLVAALLSLAALAVWAPAGHAAFLPANADFNDDGFSDVAIGAPTDSVEGQDAAGAVNVLYGGPGGLSARGNQQFTQATPGIGDAPEEGDRLGQALAAGDLDGDGTGDLTIGVPGEGVPTGIGPDERDRPAAGMVHVLYGSREGLVARGSDTWTQDRSGIKGVTEARDGFGTAVAIGNFDGDREDDLGIGSPGEGVSGQRAAGAVNVLYGTPSGLSTDRDQLWTQNTSGIKGVAGAGFQLGSSLAANDVSSNNRDELAIGIPGARISGQGDAGAVLVLYGRSGGLSSADDLWSQDAGGVKGIAESGDHFGNALAIGDFDRDGAGDLAVGAPQEGAGGSSNAGAVNVIYGSGTGLRSDPDQLWTQDSPGIKGVAHTNEHFGAALVAVDFSRNVADDLAIGVPNDDIGGQPLAGAVNVLYGKRGGGLGERADDLWTQDSRGVKGVSGARDLFGAALTAGDVDADNDFDLVVGVPGETIAGRDGAGAINVLPGSSSGVSDRADEFWSQGSAGVSGAVGADNFGGAVASGRR